MSYLLFQASAKISNPIYKPALGAIRVIVLRFIHYFPPRHRQGDTCQIDLNGHVRVFASHPLQPTPPFLSSRSRTRLGSTGNVSLAADCEQAHLLQESWRVFFPLSNKEYSVHALPPREPSVLSRNHSVYSPPNRLPSGPNGSLRPPFSQRASKFSLNGAVRRRLAFLSAERGKGISFHSCTGPPMI